MGGKIERKFEKMKCCLRNAPEFWRLAKKFKKIIIVWKNL